MEVCNMPGTPYVLQFRVRYSDTDQAHVEYQGKVIRPPAWLVEVVED
jgi:hypothetical protein